MTHVHRTTLAAALAILLIAPAATLLAADAPAAKPAEPTSPAVTQDRMKAMHERMRQIHKATDPAKRKELIAAQMKDMEAMMNDPNNNCPMGKDGMMEGKCGMEGRGGMGMMGHHDDALAKRVEALEKRLDMMQMMMMMHMQMQMQMRMGMPGMMQPGMMPGMMQPGMMQPGMMMMPAMPAN